MSDPILIEGATGPDVSRLQRLLHDRGYFDGVINGIWSSTTTDAVIFFQQTMLGPDQKPLAVDGVVGGATWWALASTQGDQKLGLTEELPHKISKKRDDLLAVAGKFYGTVEEPFGSNRGALIDEWTGFAGPGKGPPWCCFFTSAVYLSALKKYPLGERVGSCAHAVDLAKAAGIFLARTAMPCPGDQFVMLYELKPGHGHTGFVTGVETDAGGAAVRVSTIEGNCCNRVARRIREVSTIFGFIDVIGKPRDFASGLGGGTPAKPSESTR